MVEEKERSLYLIPFFSSLSLSNITQAAEYNIFEGLECRGGPALVLSQGCVVYEEGKLQAQQGTGRFIPRKPFPDYAYQRVKFRNQVQNTTNFIDMSITVLKARHFKIFPLNCLSIFSSL